MSQTPQNAFEAIAGRLSERLQRTGSNDRRAHIILGQIHTVSAAAQKLKNAADNPNPMDTELQHLRKMADAAKRLDRFVQDRQSYMAELNTQGLADLYDARDKKAGLMAHEHSAEMRAVFRAMTDEQKGAALQQAMKDGDSDFIAAVCTCPPVLSGAPAELREAALKHIREIKAPDITAEIDDLDAAWQSANAISRAAKSVCDEYASHPKLQQIEAAESALAGANEALTGKAA